MSTPLRAPRIAAPSPVPPLDTAPALDPSALPDPPLPWPRLNLDDAASRAWLLAEGPARSRDDGKRRVVTFTFDDGPNPETAPTLLRILSEHGVRASFFFIGEYLAGTDRRSASCRQWAKQFADAGHTIGNHTFDHRVLTRLSHTAALADIDDSAAAIERVTGARPMLFRPPFGALDSWLERALRDRSLELVLWSVDVRDIKRKDEAEIAELVEEQLEYKQGGVVLLHDVHWASVRAFERILRYLEEGLWDPARPGRGGWAIVDLPEYVRTTAASPQPFATREALEQARRDLGRRAQPPVMSSQIAAALPTSFRSSTSTAQ